LQSAPLVRMRRTGSMPRLASIGAVLVANVLLSVACDTLDPSLPPQVIYLVPESFSGWVCVDFDIKVAAPLPREGATVVIRARPGVVLQTSESDDKVALAFPVEVFVEAGGSRRRLPDGVSGRRTVSRSGPNEPTTRTCRFIGTIDQDDAAGEPPGFNGRFSEGPISATERAALVALFESTGGSKWTHRVGWLGAPGTECRWHGVQCGERENDQSAVTWLNLSENNLRGTLPEPLGGLQALESLNVYGNHLTGRFPDQLIRRWASGDLWIFGHRASWLTDVSEIRLEYSSTGYTGSWHRIILNVDGKAKMFAQRLPKLWSLDRRTYCEVKDGQIPEDDFAKLAHFIERSGYYALQPEYDRTITHAAFEITSVTRNGKLHNVSDYASAGPLALWAIRQAIAGLAESATWEDVASEPNCPAPFRM
jgi:hypothetical protein